MKGNFVNNHSKESILAFLRQHAPNAPLAKSLDIANTMEVLNDENYHLKCKLALLAEILGFDDDGGYRELAHKHVNDPAVLWALDGVCHSHAWVVCGPVPNGIGKLKQEIKDKIEKGDFGKHPSFLDYAKTEEDLANG